LQITPTKISQPSKITTSVIHIELTRANDRQRHEYEVFKELLKSIPGLEERILAGSDNEIRVVADLASDSFFTIWASLNRPLQIRKGASGARADDTKGLKSAVLEWITPKGQALTPPLSRNSKVDRGFHHEITGALLCPTDLDWSCPE
jgi:hypothetical protein